MFQLKNDQGYLPPRPLLPRLLPAELLPRDPDDGATEPRELLPEDRGATPEGCDGVEGRDVCGDLEVGAGRLPVD